MYHGPKLFIIGRISTNKSQNDINPHSEIYHAEFSFLQCEIDDSEIQCYILRVGYAPMVIQSSPNTAESVYQWLPLITFVM